MPREYSGLPAAASVEQAIILAQLLIRKRLEQAPVAVPVPDPKSEVRPAA